MSNHIDRAAEVLWRRLSDPLERKVHSFADAPSRMTYLAHARDLANAGLLEQDLEIHIEDHSLTGQPATCVVKRHGVVIFDGVDRSALLRTATAAEHDAAPDTNGDQP